MCQRNIPPRSKKQVVTVWVSYPNGFDPHRLFTWLEGLDNFHLVLDQSRPHRKCKLEFERATTPDQIVGRAVQVAGGIVSFSLGNIQANQRAAQHRGEDKNGRPFKN